jgi:hypothetical protein
MLSPGLRTTNDLSPTALTELPERIAATTAPEKTSESSVLVTVAEHLNFWP